MTSNLTKALKEMAKTARISSKRAEMANMIVDPSQVISVMKMIEMLTEIHQGDKGDVGEKPVKGVDYFTLKEAELFLKMATPVKGKHYRDGIDGEPGKSIKGDKGDRGSPGIAGSDATVDMDEIKKVSLDSVKKHEKEFDHKLIDPFLLGTKKVTEKDMKPGMFLQYKGGDELSYTTAKQLAAQLNPYGLRPGFMLPSQEGNSGKFLTTNGTSSSWDTPGASAINFADDETPTGTIDGSNVTFTLAHTPTAGSLLLFLNGVKQTLTAQYTIATATITFVTAPEVSLDGGATTLSASYRYA